MTILTVALPWLGGSGTVAYRLAAYLAEQPDTTSHFLSYEHPFHTQSGTALTIDTVAVHSYPSLQHPLAELSLIDHIVQYCTDHAVSIIHAHYGIGCGHAALVAKKLLHERGHAVSLVMTFHGTDIVGPDASSADTAPFPALTGALLRDSDAVTFVSKSLQDEAMRRYDMSRDTAVIPNAVATDLFVPSTIPTAPRLIHMSTFRRIKQPLLVIDIFARVLERCPSATLVCVGDGPEYQRVRQYAARLGVAHRISFTGNIPEQEVVRQLQQARVLILPSVYESFSLAALEAHACGVPVVASRVGGIRDVVTDGKTGYLIADIQHADAFADAVMPFLTDAEPAFRERARAQALRFSHTAVYQQYQALYAALQKK